jgi:hypothetical protein
MIPLGDMLDHLSQAYSFKEIRLRGVAITDMVKFNNLRIFISGAEI